MNRYMIFGVVAIVLAGSCAKDSGDGIVSADGTVLCVNVPQVNVKTSLGKEVAGEYPVLWSEGDVIVVNGVKSLPLTAEQAGRPDADFVFDASLSFPYKVTYTGVEGRQDVVNIPCVQRLLPSSTFDSFTVPMWAMSSSVSDIYLDYIGAVLKIPVSGDVSIAHVSVTSTGGEPLSGIFKVGFSGGDLVPVSRSNTVSLVPETALELSAEGTVELVAVVAPGSYSKGIDVALVSTDGEVMHLHSFTGVTVAAGVVYEYPSTVFAADDRYDLTISSSSQLADFKSRVEGGENTLSAVLLSDVEADFIEPVVGFAGVFDGGGHTISGLTCPMFGELKGIVRNLIVDSDIVCDLPSYGAAWTGILAQRIAGDSGANPFTGSLINCKVKGSLTVTNTSTSANNANVGGLVGYMVRGKLVNCINEAVIKADAAASTKRLNVGGVAGRIYSGGAVIEVKGCVNKGQVTASGTPTVYNVGGVIGESDTKSGIEGHPNTIVSCMNLGKVTVNASSTSEGSASGDIAGRSTNEQVDCL